MIDKTHIARQLGNILRDLRKQSKLTGQELAARTGLSQSKISKIENGYPEKIHAAEIESMLKILKPSKTVRQRLSILMYQRDATQLMQSTFTMGSQAWQASSLERKAETIRIFTGNYVAALLQTIAFREALLRLYIEEDDTLRANIQDTLARQDTMLGGTRTYHFIMSENVLYQHSGDVRVFLAQLDRLERLQEVQGIRLGIIPLERGLGLFENGSFALYDERALCTLMGDVEIFSINNEEILKYLGVFNQLDIKACYDQSAAQLIRKAAAYFGAGTERNE